MVTNGDNNFNLDSYQHCPPKSDRDTLNGSEEFENGDADINIDVGVSVGNHHSRWDHDAYLDSSFLSFVPLKQRKRGQATMILLFGILCLGLGWFASDVVFSSGRRRQAATGAGDSIEQILDKTDASEHLPDLIWSDEFDGDSVDLTKWTFVNGNGCDVGLCGWGNNELEWYTPSNAHVSNGKLTIEARKFVTPGSPPSYTSAKIISRGKADFGVVDTTIDKESRPSEDLEKSRRFESRLKLPWGHGIWPAFWMMPTYNTYGGWPRSGEIDIMENIGKEGPNTVHGTVHYGLDGPQHQYSESGITLSASQRPSPSTPSTESLNETFHTYAVERLPGVIRWFIDDIEYSSVTEENIKPYHWSFDEEFYFIFNLAVGGNWPGNPLDEGVSGGDATVFSQRLEVDYVRVYEGIFPRINGKSVVDCSEKEVVYEVVNIDETANGKYTWVVPQHATINEGQGTSRITVDFNSTVIESNIIDNEIIHVQASGLDNPGISMGLMKLHENGIGTRIKIVDYDGSCSSTTKTNLTLKEFNFDCGRPADCNPFILHRVTDEFTCGERIEWLINEMKMGEKEACREVGYVQFHGHCGPCNPLV